MTAPVRVAVVIVTYNSADVLGDCLRSLTDQGVDLDAVVVADNASSDKTLAIARDVVDSLPMGADSLPMGADALPLAVVELGRNAGYAAAINAGVATLDLSRFDAILVLNPDCRLNPGTTGVLAAALFPGAGRPGEPRRAIAAPLLLNPDGSLQPTLRRRPGVTRALVESLTGSLAPRLGPLAELITDEASHRRPGPVAWATGAAMLISVQAWRELGPWDESFLLYSEETEYCLRAADRGWSTWYEPASVVEHIGGESGTNPMLSALIAVNRVTLFRRRHNPIHSAAYFAAVLTGEAIRAAAGRRTARAAVTALLRPSRRVRALDVRESTVRELKS